MGRETLGVSITCTFKSIYLDHDTYTHTKKHTHMQEPTRGGTEVREVVKAAVAAVVGDVDIKRDVAVAAVVGGARMTTAGSSSLGRSAGREGVRGRVAAGMIEESRGLRSHVVDSRGVT